MRQITVFLALGILLSNLSGISGFCAGQADRQAEVEVWKQQMSQRGTGEKSKWEARLLDGRKIRGYASEIQQEGFTLVDTKSGASFDLDYADIEALKPLTGLSKGAKIALVAGIAAGAVLLVGAIVLSQSEGF